MVNLLAVGKAAAGGYICTWLSVRHPQAHSESSTVGIQKTVGRPCTTTSRLNLVTELDAIDGLVWA